VTGSTLGSTGGLSFGRSSPAAVKDPYDGINVTGAKLNNLSGINFDSSLYGAPVEGPSAFEQMYQPQDDIVVTGERPPTPAIAGFGTPLVAPTQGALTPEILRAIERPVQDEIVVDGTRVQPTNVSVGDGGVGPTGPLSSDIVVTGPGKFEPKSVSADIGLGSGPVADILPALKQDPALTDKKKLGLEDYLRMAGLLAGAVGKGGSGGSGGAGTYVPGGRGLNPIFSAKLPTANIPGGVGDASRFAARPLGYEDWLTYATRPELSFFDYVKGRRGMAEGGSLAEEHGGQSHRTEFAVNGPGAGRSDDIPAVLSDGEYVIDAETVALLGDGSNKAGAKKLDDLRVKVRKHKGQKLTKGRFSANAKKPEAYLSGGRI